MSKHSNKHLKRAALFISGAAAVLGLASCTKSFCTNQDKANQLYAAYGNIFEPTIDQKEVDKTDSENAQKTKNANREALYSTLTNNYGYSLPDQAFMTFITDKAEKEANNTYTVWLDDTNNNESQAKDIAFHVALYAGLDDNNNVQDLWTNFDAWYEQAVADPEIGILKTPSTNYVTIMKNTMNSVINQNYACIAPSNEFFRQDGTNIYIEGKSWGQSFKQFGFLEGLFVYPFAYIVHAISENLGDSGWAQILAIFVVTLLVRSVTVISSISQSKQQAKQQAIQPQLEELQKKFPDSQTDKDQRQQFAMAQAQLMKKNKVHPMFSLLFLIIQFPLFICVWSALQGSAALASGNWFGLSLTTRVSTCIQSYSTTPGALTGVLIFVFMSLANILSSLTGLWMNNWRTKNFGSTTPAQKDANGNTIDPNRTMKIMTYVMMVFVIFMGWNLPAAMGIYWFIGAVMSIAQTILMEAIQSRHRHQLQANTGDGSTLAAIRRSKHHDNKKPNKKDKKNKSDKPLWR